MVMGFVWWNISEKILKLGLNLIKSNSNLEIDAKSLSEE